MLQQLMYLKREHLGVFYGARENTAAASKPLPLKQISTDPGLSFSVDNVGKVGAPANGSTVTIDSSTVDRFGIIGWAIDRVAREPAESVYINIDGETDIAASRALPRPDVAAAFNMPSYASSGFKAVVSAQSLGLGQHTLSLKIVSADGTSYSQPEFRLTLDVQ